MGRRNGLLKVRSQSRDVVTLSTQLTPKGMSQGLAKEVAPFGIRVLIVQPGAFETNMADAVTVQSAPLTEAYKSSEVGQWLKVFSAKPGERTLASAAPNDVDKGCQGSFEVVTGTGRGKGKEEYIRLPLSEDCAMRTTEQIDRLKGGYEAFKDIWSSTRRDDAEGNVMKP